MDFHTTIHNPQFVDRPGNARQISTALPFLHPLHWGTVRSDYTSHVYGNKITSLTLPKATPECSFRCLAFHHELRRRRDLCVQVGHVHVKTPKNRRGHAMDMPICRSRSPAALDPCTEFNVSIPFGNWRRKDSSQPLTGGYGSLLGNTDVSDPRLPSDMGLRSKKTNAT